MKVAMSVLDRGRLHISSLSVGIAERLVEEMTRYASERKQFGKPIIEHQLVMAMLADSYAEAAAGREVSRHRAADGQGLVCAGCRYEQRSRRGAHSEKASAPGAPRLPYQ